MAQATVQAMAVRDRLSLHVMLSMSDAPGAGTNTEELRPPAGRPASKAPWRSRPAG